MINIMMTMEIAILLFATSTNGQLNSTMNNTLVLETTDIFPDLSSTMLYTTSVDNNEDAPWYEIDEWTKNPMEWDMFQYIVAGVILLFLILCICSCSWWCCCRNKGDDGDNLNFMNNPKRYDSEFPGAEMQGFSTYEHKDRGVDYVE